MTAILTRDGPPASMEKMKRRISALAQDPGESRLGAASFRVGTTDDYLRRKGASMRSATIPKSSARCTSFWNAILGTMPAIWRGSASSITGIGTTSNADVDTRRMRHRSGLDRPEAAMTNDTERESEARERRSETPRSARADDGSTCRRRPSPSSPSVSQLSR